MQIFSNGFHVILTKSTCFVVQWIATIVADTFLLTVVEDKASRLTGLKMTFSRALPPVSLVDLLGESL